MHSVTLHIPALECSEELVLIERALQRTTGTTRLAPDYLTHELRVDFDPALTNPAQIDRAVRAAGFDTQVKLDAVHHGSLSPVTQQQPLSVSMVAGGALLLIAGLARICVGDTNSWIAAAAIASAVISGLRVAAAAWRAIRLRVLDMNVLMTVAAASRAAVDSLTRGVDGSDRSSAPGS
jgi:cation transport ATPase